MTEQHLCAHLPLRDELKKRPLIDVPCPQNINAIHLGDTEKHRAVHEKKLIPQLSSVSSRMFSGAQKMTTSLMIATHKTSKRIFNTEARRNTEVWRNNFSSPPIPLRAPRCLSGVFPKNKHWLITYRTNQCPIMKLLSYRL